MWHQYGEKHSGACLAFDAERLVVAAESSVGSNGQIRTGPVDYRDQPVSGSDGRLHFATSALRQDLPGTARNYVADNFQSLFMTKNLDWASEE
jgi:hypothetical protein